MIQHADEPLRRPPGRFNTPGLLRKAFQVAASLPAEATLRVLAWPPIEKAILGPLYEKTVAAHRPRLPSLDPEAARIVTDLDERGLSVTSLRALSIPGSDDFLAEAQAVAAELAARAAAPEQRGRHTLTAGAEHLLRHPAIFRWGLSERLLAIVEGYLRLPVAYDGLSFYYSVADGSERGPRLWHRDREDRRMVKVGIYVNDVSEYGGPFQTLTPEANSRLCRDGDYRYRVLGTPEVEASLGDHLVGWHRTVTGPAGTVFFAETARLYHRGKPPTDSDRAAIFFGYFARQPRHPFLCERSPLSRRQVRQLAEGLTARQIGCALWWEDQPAAFRLIPKNRVTV